MERLPLEIQEMVEMLNGRDTHRYNCSGKTESEWYGTGIKHPGWAAYFISAGFFFQLIGWPVLYIFLTKFVQHHALKVYRVMMFIGLIEVTEVWGVSIWPGVANLYGEVYCTSRRLSTFFGKVTMVQWLFGSASAVLLGLHRLSDMARKGEVLFDTHLKTFVWLASIFVYAVYGSLFYDTVLFNSDYMAPLLDPMIGTPDVEYSNKLLYFHNIFISILLILVYTILCIIWSTRELIISSIHVSKFQRTILLQSIGISLTYTIPALSFVSLYIMSAIPKWFFLVSDISFQLSGGLPFVMYICLNRKVRDELLMCLKITEDQTRHSTAVVPGSIHLHVVKL